MHDRLLHFRPEFKAILIFYQRRYSPRVCYAYCSMSSNLLEEAVKVLRGLPDDRQQAAVRAIIDYGADDNDVQLSDEQVAEIEQRIASPNRKFISLAELDKRIRNLGV